MCQHKHCQVISQIFCSRCSLAAATSQPCSAHPLEQQVVAALWVVLELCVCGLQLRRQHLDPRRV